VQEKGQELPDLRCGKSAEGSHEHLQSNNCLHTNASHIKVRPLNQIDCRALREPIFHNVLREAT